MKGNLFFLIPYSQLNENVECVSMLFAYIKYNNNKIHRTW